MHIAKSHHKCRIISTQTKNMSLKTCTHINTYLYIYIYIHILHTYIHMFNVFNKSKPLPGLHRRCQGWRMGSAARDLGTPSRLCRAPSPRRGTAPHGAATCQRFQPWKVRKKNHRLDQNKMDQHRLDNPEITEITVDI